MNVNVSHPTGRENFTVVSVGELTLWFSYSTCVAYSIGDGPVVRENDWSATTGKHLNYIDGGAKKARISGEEFTRRLAAMNLEVAISPVPV